MCYLSTACKTSQLHLSVAFLIPTHLNRIRPQSATDSNCSRLPCRPSWRIRSRMLCCATGSTRGACTASPRWACMSSNVWHDKGSLPWTLPFLELHLLESPISSVVFDHKLAVYKRVLYSAASRADSPAQGCGVQASILPLTYCFHPGINTITRPIFFG